MRLTKAYRTVLRRSRTSFNVARASVLESSTLPVLDAR
jgi:hypothetical protein